MAVFTPRPAAGASSRQVNHAVSLAVADRLPVTAALGEGPSAAGSGDNAAQIGATRRLIREGAAYTASRGLQFVAALLIVPIATRLVSQAAYGEIGLSMLVLQIVGLLGTAGLPAVITRDYFAPDGPHRAAGVISMTMIIAAATGTIAYVTGPVWVRALGDLQFDGGLRLAIMGGVALSIVTCCQSYFQAARRIGDYVLASLLASVGAQILGLVLLARGPRSSTSYLLGILVGTLAAAMLSLRRTGMRRLRTADRPLLRSALAIGLPTVPHSLGLVLLATGDRFVIQRIDGLAAVGQYQAAYALGSLGLVGLAAFNNAWAPLIYGAADHVRWHRLAVTGHDIHRLVALAAGLSALASPWLLAAALPRGYDLEPLADIAAVVAFCSVPYVIYLANVHVLFQEGHTRSLALITPLCAGINVGVNLLVVPIVGIRGAAFTSVATYAVQAVLVHLAARRLAAVPWQPRIMFKWTALGALFCGLSDLLPLHGPAGFVRGGVLAAGLVALALLLRSLLVDPDQT